MFFATWVAFVGLALTPVAISRFTFTYRACWRRNCILHNDADTVCFDSSDNGLSTPPCDDKVLLTLLDTHINSSVGLSIAYYDEVGNFLGPSTWSVPQPLPWPIFVCMSGRMTDVEGPAYRTICRSALHDDDIRVADAHKRECSVPDPQIVVTDGCYIPPSKARSTPSSDKGSFFDNPLLNHIFFVLGAVTTVVALYSMVLQFRKPVMSTVANILSAVRRNVRWSHTSLTQPNAQAASHAPFLE